MRHFLCGIAAATLLASPVLAEEPSSPAPNMSEGCKETSRYARGIMKSRQQGAPMSGLVEANDSALGQFLIEMAYEHPRHETKEKQERAISDFEKEGYTGCLEFFQDTQNSPLSVFSPPPAASANT